MLYGVGPIDPAETVTNVAAIAVRQRSTDQKTLRIGPPPLLMGRVWVELTGLSTHAVPRRRGRAPYFQRGGEAHHLPLFTDL